MPTGINLKGKLAQLGSINTQALEPLEVNFGALNAENSAVVGTNKIAIGPGEQGFENVFVARPYVNRFVAPLVTLPPLVFRPFTLDLDADSILINSVSNALFNPMSYRGFSEQRPEVLMLSDYNPIFENFGSEFTDAGEFVSTAIAGRKIRFEHIKSLIDSIEEVEEAKDLLDDIKQDYANQIKKGKETVQFIRRILLKIRNIKSTLNVRQSEVIRNRAFAKNLVKARTYKDFLVEEYQFTESGFNNFSSTKIIGQFLFDARNSLKQYSPSLFGTKEAPPASLFNAGIGNFAGNNQGINDDFAFAAQGLGEAEEQTVNRSADREYGTYNVNELDITDGQFNFQVRLFSNLGAPLLNTPYYQFLDTLPGTSGERAVLLLLTLSKEMRISSGLGEEDISDLVINKFGGSSTGDPFKVIIGRPGRSITDKSIGNNNLCSLLRFVNGSGEVVLPFEDNYVKGDDGRVYIPGTKEFADSIIQSEEPYSTENVREFQEKVSDIASDAIEAIAGLLDVGQSSPKLKGDDLFKEIGNDILEIIDNLSKVFFRLRNTVPDDENVPVPGAWGELMLIKLAASNKQIRHLLFQYVLTLGLIGKPGEVEFGSNVRNSFFQRMTRTEIKKWGDLPIVFGDRDLGSTFSEYLQATLEELGFGEEGSSDTLDDFTFGGNETIDTGDIRNVSTQNIPTGYTVLAFIAQRLISRAKQLGDNSETGNSFVVLDFLKRHLVSTKDLVIFNKMADFIGALADRAVDYDIDGKTRLNRLSYTTVAAFSFEAYMSMVDLAFTSVSEPNTLDEQMRATVAPNELTFNRLAIIATLNQTNSEEILQFLDTNGTTDEIFFSTLRSKVFKEDLMVSQIIDRIRRTFEGIQASASDAINFFNPNGPNKALLDELINVQGGRERVALMSEAQNILSRKALKDFNDGEGLGLLTKNVITHEGGGNGGNLATGIYLNNQYIQLPIFNRIITKKEETPVFFDNSVIKNNERKVMELVLNRPKFKGRRAENLKVLTVGIPAGFSNFLDREISVNEDRFNAVRPKEKDVISINVYRRSVEFEDIVFKPMPHIFELSRFITRRDINVSNITSNTFNDFINSETVKFMTDFSELARGKRENQERFFNDEDYDFLSINEKRELIENHLESFVIGLYTQLLTGVSTDEQDYLVDESLLEGFVDDEAKQRFGDLLLTYIRGVTGQSISLEQLKNLSPQIKQLLEKIDDFRVRKGFTEQLKPIDLPGVSTEQKIEISEDILNFVKLYNPKSLLTGGNIQYIRMTSPKLFERIYNLAIDPDDFEIDIEKTLSTQSGARMFRSLVEQGVIVQGVEPGSGRTVARVRERSKNRTISLDQYFVNISTVEAARPKIPKQKPNRVVRDVIRRLRGEGLR